MTDVTRSVVRIRLFFLNLSEIGMDPTTQCRTRIFPKIVHLVISTNLDIQYLRIGTYLQLTKCKNVTGNLCIPVVRLYLNFTTSYTEGKSL